MVTQPAPPTDPDVRNERIRFLGSQSVGTTLAHHCAARQTTQMLWTIWGVGKTSIASSFWHFSQSIALLLLRRRNPYRHACSASRRTFSSRGQLPPIPSYRKGPRRFTHSRRYWDGRGACRLWRHPCHNAFGGRRSRCLAVLRL